MANRKRTDVPPWECHERVTLHSDHGGELVVVNGPRPYLWVGGKDNRCVATVETSTLRELHEAIGAALRHAGECKVDA